MEGKVRIIQTTLPGEWIEPKVADFCQAVLDSGAACTQFSRIHSMYRWEGKTQSESEWRIQIKSSQNNAPDVVSKIHNIHPYDTPQIISWDADANEDYIEWANST